MRAFSAYDMGLSHFPDAGSRRSAPGLGDVATVAGGAAGTAVAGPIGGAVGSEAAHLVEGMFGGTGKYGTVQSEGAEQARIDAAVLGIQAGSLDAARFLLGQASSDTSNYAKNATATAVSRMELAAPSVMNQAKALGPMFDQADGLGVLTILSNLGIPFSDQYAGYNTTTTQPGSAAAMSLAGNLRRLNPNATLPGGLPASFAVPGTTARVNTTTLAAGAAVIGAVLLLSKHGRR